MTPETRFILVGETIQFTRRRALLILAAIYLAGLITPVGWFYVWSHLYSYEPVKMGDGFEFLRKTNRITHQSYIWRPNRDGWQRIDH